MDLYKIRQELNMGVQLTQMELRVTHYSRVSTEHLEQKKSLKHQIDHFDKVIKDNPKWTYVKGYVDDGISGTSDIKRDNFMQMIEDARNNKFDLIITKEISRFSRNTLDSIKYTRELLSCGVAVLFVNDNINTALPDSELRLTIMASMAQDEVRRLSERVKFGMSKSISEGNILGNDTMYGYKKDKLSGNLVIIEEQALVVRRIFSLYAVENKTLNSIANILNNEKIPTALNKKWRPSSLSRMISNIKYKGYYCGGKTQIIDYMTKQVKYIPKSDWVIMESKIKIPPIVSEELWDAANKRLAQRRKPFGEAYKKDKVMYQNRYLFSAKIYCAHHNEVFHRRKQLKASDDISWLCAKYLKEGKKACNTANIRESELYMIFDDIIEQLRLDYDSIIRILLNLYNSSKKNNTIDEKMNVLINKRDKLMKMKDKLLELNIEGNISNSEFSQRNNKCNTELNEVENEIETLEKNKIKFQKIEGKSNELKKILQRKVKVDLIRDKIIKLILDKIVVSTIDNDNNNVELNIFFNFSNQYLEKEEKKIIPKVDNFKNFMRKKYVCKRGYGTTSTKRYEVYYHVNSYICL